MLKLIKKIFAMPLILILAPLNLLGKLLMHVSVFAVGTLTLLFVLSLCICISEGYVSASVMAVLTISAGAVMVLAVGLINVFLEDAMGALLRFMVS